MAIDQQRRINSGLGARTTAAEAVAGRDLSGKRALITGGYSGIGLETVRALRAAGAQVVVAGRDPEKARQALAGLDAAFAPLDLSDQLSVSAFVRGWDQPLDMLILNAAIMACPETRIGPAGWEAQLGTNHLGHYALAMGLGRHLREGARVVSLSSIGHRLSPMRWEDPHWRRGDYDKWRAYGQAKTANALFAVALDALWKDRGVRAFAVHPGGIMTALQRHLPREEMIAMGWMDEAGVLNPLFKTPEQGAATTVWCATAIALEGLGGLYCEDCDVAEPMGEGRAMTGVRAYAVDPQEAERLMHWSAGELA